jgi:hypothetical protein
VKSGTLGAFEWLVIACTAVRQQSSETPDLEAFGDVDQNRDGGLEVALSARALTQHT